MARNQDKPTQKSTRERLIEDAQVRCHQTRSDVQNARHRMSSVPRSLRADLQSDVLTYYRALRPLRTEGLIKDWWQKVELSEHWISHRVFTFQTEDGEKKVGEQQAARIMEEYDAKPTDIESVPYAGLGRLDELEDAVETVTEEKTTMRGTQTQQTTRQVVLRADQLMDIAGVLDDAATKLGFSPDIELQDAAGETV